MSAVPLTQPLCAMCLAANLKSRVLAVTQVGGTTVCGPHAADILAPIDYAPILPEGHDDNGHA